MLRELAVRDAQRKASSEDMNEVYQARATARTAA